MKGLKGGMDGGREGGSILQIHCRSQNAPLRNLTSLKIDRAGLGEVKNKSVYFFVFWESLPPTSPKSKIECSQFTEFFGLFPLLGRFAFNIFKKWICPISLALIGLFGKKTKQTLRLDCPFGIWSKESGQFLPNIISQKYSLAFPNRNEQVHSPQNEDKNNTNFRRKCQR